MARSAFWAATAFAWKRARGFAPGCLWRPLRDLQARGEREPAAVTTTVPSNRDITLTVAKATSSPISAFGLNFESLRRHPRRLST